MPPMLPELTAVQTNKIQLLRAALIDVLKQQHDDYLLMCFLIARNWNVDEAEQMLRNNLKTRDIYNINNLEKWDPPEVLKNYFPYGHVGFDKEGSPVVFTPFYNFDMWGILHCVTRLDFQKYLLKFVETFTRMAYENSKTHGYKSRKLVLIYDMKDFSMRQYAWKPALDCMLSAIKLNEELYPEFLKTCYIINAPALFSIAFNMLRNILDETTISKLHVSKAGSDCWQEVLYKHVSPDVIPKCLGGNLVDENGDAECKTMITWGGKVPQELYVVQNERNSNRTYVEAILSKSSKLKLDFETGQQRNKSQILSWDFRSYDYDIKFGIQSHDLLSGENRNEIDVASVSSHEMDEIGFINTRANTKYTFIFENSAIFRSKKLRYWVELIDEVDDFTQKADGS